MKKGILGLILLSCSSFVFANDYGISFNCSNSSSLKKEELLKSIQKEIKINGLSDFAIIEKNNDVVNFYIDKNKLKSIDTTKISLDFNIDDELIYSPTLNNKLPITSKKEILISLLYPGRLTSISSCGYSDLKEHIGIRQNIVLWANKLEWQWPDGEPAFWNTKYWNKGTPLNLKNTYWALFDSFKFQNKYGIGCYTATKMVYAFSLLDYYKRVNPNLKKYNLILNSLISDKEPLVAVEPGIMWKFESDYDSEKDNYQGKILEIHDNIAPNSIVAGDWIYLLNTDKETYQKTGYEGSNAIYLGKNKFDDYYNDNNHSYTFEEKLDEVYQWRNKVFSRTRDHDKIEHLSLEKLQSLKSTPDNNGLFVNTRTVPKLF